MSSFDGEATTSPSIIFCPTPILYTECVKACSIRSLTLRRSSVVFNSSLKSLIGEPPLFGPSLNSPIFMVFDVSPTSDGSLINNIREVRREGTPSMQWGYIDGRRSHLGAMASQGFTASSKFPGYTIWMEDRCDVFIEDMSRTVLIEEIPQF